jgi:nitroreductase
MMELARRQHADAAPDARDVLVRALQFRFACKVFDESRKIAPADLTYILEAGRLSPSSLGLEPWRFIVVHDEMLRRRLRPSCWNQVQITTASALIVILALKAELAPDSDYSRRMLSRLLPFGADLDELVKIYSSIAHEHRTSWSVAQCHIAAANMMTAAATIGIDTCPMGGFEPEAVADILGIDRHTYAIALMVAVGYRAQPQPPKQRLPLSDLVTYR